MRLSQKLPRAGDLNSVSFSPCETYIEASGTDNSTFVFDRRFPSRPVFVAEHDSK
jgi:hypothetical protein